MKCTNCQACTGNGGHCVNEEFDIVLADNINSKPKFIYITPDHYNEMKDKIKQQEDKIKQLEDLIEHLQYCITI